MHPPLNNQHKTDNIVMLHHEPPIKPFIPNASAPKNVCERNASSNYDKRYYTLIRFKSLRELETLVNIGKKLTNKLKKKKYVGSVLGRCLLGQVILQCPKVGGATLASIISLLVADFLADCDTTSLLHTVPFVYPSGNTLKIILVEEATDSILLERHTMKDKTV